MDLAYSFPVCLTILKGLRIYSIPISAESSRIVTLVPRPGAD